MMETLPGIEVRCPACPSLVAAIRHDAYDPAVAAPLITRHIQRSHGLDVWRAVVEGLIPMARDLARNPGHGTRSRYQTGCHCAACRRANAEYLADYRFRRASTSRRRARRARW